MLRNEYKYLVPMEKLDHLRRAIAPFVDTDHYAFDRAGHHYTVRSIYFDRPSLPFYHEKLAGLAQRKKIRIRGYNAPQPDSRVFLEIKRKYGVHVEKQRAPVLLPNLQKLFASREIEKWVICLPGFEHAFYDAQRFFYNVIALGLQPVVLIVYEREAYFGKFDNRLRLTFDKMIRCRPMTRLDIFCQERLEPVLDRYFVFEIKFFRGLPHWLSTIIRDMNLRRQSVSKYAYCLEKVNLTSLLPVKLVK